MNLRTRGRRSGASTRRSFFRGVAVVAFSMSIVVTITLFWILPTVVWRFGDPSRAANMTFAWTELYNFDAMNGSLPIDIVSNTGQPLISWRSISADGEAAPRLGDISAPWNAAVNKRTADWPCSIYCFWLSRMSKERLNTKVLAVAGPDTAFDPACQHSLQGLPSDLILLVEVWETGIHWLEPGDISGPDCNRLRIDGPDGKGCHVVFADGTWVFLSVDAPLEDVRKLCTLSGSESHERNELLGSFIDTLVTAEEMNGQ